MMSAFTPSIPLPSPPCSPPSNSPHLPTTSVVQNLSPVWDEELVQKLKNSEFVPKIKAKSPEPDREPDPPSPTCVHLLHPTLQFSVFAFAFAILAYLFNMEAAPLTYAYAACTGVILLTLIASGARRGLHIACIGMLAVQVHFVVQCILMTRDELVEALEMAQRSVVGFHILAMLGAAVIGIQPEAILTDRMKLLTATLYLGIRLLGFTVLCFRNGKPYETAEMYVHGDLLIFAPTFLITMKAVARTRKPSPPTNGPALA